ncbi:MAG: tetratricopeptide repeat protein [Bacteroidia bacterium]|nr:tetratricopeptide repeat protein [Bacteroidia bacterium]
MIFINKYIIIFLFNLLNFFIYSFICFGQETEQDEIYSKLDIDEKHYLEFKYNYFEGSKQKMLGNYDMAIGNFSKCREIIPKNAATHYELANIYYLQRDYVTALTYAKQAVKLDKSEGDFNIYYYLQLAKLYEENGSLSASADVYKNIIKKYPASYDIALQYALLLSRLNKNNESLKILNKIESQTGISESVSLEKERIYTMDACYDKAINELQNLISAFPNEPRYYGMLADSYTSFGQYDKALEIYKQLLQIDPGNGKVHIALANYYYKLNDTDKSYEELKLAYSNLEVDIDFKIRTIIDNFSSNDSKTKGQAYELIQILLQTYPDNPKSYTIYADFLIQDKRFPEARDQLRQAVKYEKSLYQVWEQLILLEIEQNNFKDVFEESKEALAYFPNNPSFYLYNGISAIKLKRYSDAVESLKQGVELVINNRELKTQFYTNLGEAYDRNKNYHKSDSIFELILSYEPDNKIILNNYSYYLSLRSDSLAKAKAMSHRCVELEPDNSTFLDTHAWVLYKLNEIEPAREIIEKALKHGGAQNAVLVEHYGDILFKAGEKDKALEQWKFAKELGKGSEFLELKIDKKVLIE